HARPADLARALKADLAQAKPTPPYLFLDQLDYLTLDDDARQFFQHLLYRPALPIVINSRYLRWHFWSPFVSRGQAQLVGDDWTGGEQPTIDIHAFSHGNVLAEGVPVTDWNGPLVRNLFYYLVDHPMVTRAEIFETFWPELPVKEATNVFHVTKRKIT